MISKQHGILLITIVLLFLTACTTDRESKVENKEKKRDELVLSIKGEPSNGFDPTTGWGRYGSPLFQSTLFKRDNDLNIVNDLAIGYEVSEDGKVWTVTLREDVTFSDGVNLTGEDVKFTFETALQKGSIVDFTNLEKVEVENSFTVRFTLKSPQSTFIHSLVETGIVPVHAYSDKYAQQPIGSGPYEFVQWDKGQQLIVKANPNYYGNKPYFQRITFLFLNEDATFATAQAGQVDIAAIPATFTHKEVKGMRLEAIRSVDSRGIAFPYVESGHFTEDGLPIGNDVTADPAIRKAMNVAIDRQALIDGVLDGYGSKAYTSVDGLPWWNEETVFEDSNLLQAEQILADAGWIDSDDDGIVEKDGVKAQFSLYYPADDAIRQSLSIVVADMLKQLGIAINVEGASWDKIEQKMYSNAVMMGWGSHNPQELYNVYSSNFAGIEYYNTGFYKNDVVDGYLEKALTSNDVEEALSYWQKAQWDGTTGISADTPWAWLVNIDHVYLIRDNLDIGNQRVQPHGHGWPLTSNIEQWKWVKEE